MRTTAGKECKFYYADYYRGRNKQECRLVAGNRASEPWTPGMCQNCPVPGILQANACTNLLLEGRIVKTFLGLGRQMTVSAVCTKTLQDVDKPHVGCGQCHTNLDNFK